MKIFLVTFVVMLAAVGAMAIGVILNGRRITGTCGGLNNIKGLEETCEICSTPCEKRRKALERQKHEQGVLTEKSIHLRSLRG